MKSYKVHLVVWLIYYSYVTASDILLGEYGNFMAHILYFLCHNVFIFYTASFCLQKASFKNIPSSLKTILLFTCGFLSFAALRYFYRFFLQKYLQANYTPVGNFREFEINTVLWYIHIFLYALGYYYMMKFIRKERELRQIAELNQNTLAEKFALQARYIDLEKEKLALKQDNFKKEQHQLQTEYAFLRSQIAPHFLHNTLNFFYSKSLTGNTQELSEAILTLSEIMRYSLQKEETGTKEVLLSEEIEHIKNVIKINQMRFNNSLKIDFIITGNIENIRIIPLVLITLIENAFKHGDLNNQNAPLTISLDIHENAVLHFTVANNKKKGPKELSHGIGLANIRRRLDIAYPQLYSMKIEEDETSYRVSLKIEYNPDQKQVLQETAFNER